MSEEYVQITDKTSWDYGLWVKAPETTVSDASKGDSLVFRTYELRVEADPQLVKGRIVIQGRSSKDGGLHTKKYLPNTRCWIKRKGKK